MTTTNLIPSAIGDIPEPIVRSLRKLINRVRALIVLRGLCATLAAAIGALLAAMAVDAGVTLFADWMRWALSGAALAVTAAAAGAFLLRPLVRSFTLAGIAQAIEVRHPEMQERVSSAVELLTSRDGPALRGSEALIGALVAQASRTAQGIQPRREAPLRSIRPFLLAAGAVSLTLAVLLIAWPDKTARLLARAVAPYLNLPNVAAADLQIVPDADSVLVEGERLRVEVRVVNSAVDSAEFRLVGPDGRDAVESMTRLPRGEDPWPRFALVCPPARESFRYRLRAGDALSRYYNVTVVPPPAIRALAVRYEYPAYTHLPPRSETPSDAGIRAVVGTVVEILVSANKPVAKAELLLNDQPEQTVAGEGGLPNVAFRLPLRQAMRGRWAVRLTDAHGFAGLSEEYGIEALADRKPVVQILRPKNTLLRLKPADTVPLLFRVRDDFGLSSVELAMEADGKPLPSIWLIRPRTGEAPLRAVADKLELHLDQYPLKDARQMTFQLRAADNLPADLQGPQQGASETYTIRFDLDAPSLASQMELANELRVRAGLMEVLEHLKESKKDSAPLREALAKFLNEGERKDKAREAAERRAKEEADRKAAEQAEKDVARRDGKAKTKSESARREQQAAQLRTLLRQQEMKKEWSAKWRHMPQLDEKELAILKTEIPLRTGRTGERLVRADEILRRLIVETAEGTYDPMSLKLTDLADNHVARAGNLVMQLPLTEEALERYDLADEADFQIDRAIEIVSELLKEFNVMTEAVRKAQKLQELAEQQADLAAAKAKMDRMKAESQASEDARKPMTDQEWQKAQMELARDLAEMVRQDPQAAQIQTDKDRQESRDLASEARELAKKQLALAGDSQRLEEMRQVDQKLQALAAEQRKLAEQAGKEPAAAPQAPRMAEAADKLQARQLPQAIQNQSQAEAGLKKDAAELERKHAPSELARQARELAQQQEALARQTESAKTTNEAAEGNRKNLDQQAARAAQAAGQADKQFADKLADLHKRQKDLAEQTRRLEKEGGRQANQTSEAMEQAARKIQEKDVDKAAQAAARAKEQADQLQRGLRQAAESQADKQTREAQKDHELAAKAAEQKIREADEKVRAAERARGEATEQSTRAAEAEKKAQAAQAAATEARKRADQAAEQARKASGDQAKEAQARAEEAKREADRKAGEASQQAQAARQTGQKAAEQTGKAAEADKNSQAAKAAAQEAQKQAQAAGEKSRQTQEAAKAALASTPPQPGGPPKDSLEAAGDRSKRGAKIAEDQARIAEELGKLGREDAPRLAEARKQERQAGEQKAQADKAVADARKGLGDLAHPQEELARKADELTKRAEAAAPAARQAAQQHNPTGSMKEATQAMRSAQAEKSSQAAGEAARKAGELADALAKAASEPQAPAAAGEGGKASHEARKLDELAAKQAELRKKAEELAGKSAGLESVQENRQSAALAAAQDKLAHDAAKLSDRVKDVEPQTDRIETAAARDARKAAQELQRGKTDQAGRSAKDAAGELAELAGRLGKDPSQSGKQSGQQASPQGQPSQDSGQSGQPAEAGKSGEQPGQSGQPGQDSSQKGQQSGKPGQSGEQSGQQGKSGQPSQSQSGQQDGKGGGQGAPTPKGDQVAVAGSPDQEPDQVGEILDPRKQAKAELAEDAAELASRQQNLAEQIQALAEGRKLDLTAAQQREVNAGTQELARDTQLVRDHAESIVGDPAVTQAAAAATQELTRAEQAQGVADRELAKQSPGGAATAQGASADALAAAAKALDNLGQQLAGKLQGEPSRRKDESSEAAQLSDAMEAAGEAARAASANGAARAAQLLAQLARQAAQQAQAQGLTPNGDPMSMAKENLASQGGGGGTGVGLTPIEPTAAQLAEMGISISDWARLSGELRNEILQAAEEGGPAEYRPLIRRYFRELARRGQEQAAPGEPDREKK